MATGLGGFGQLSLFLTLAFGFPGIVYLGFAFLYFPGTVAELIDLLNSLAPAGGLFASLVGLAAVLFAGLTLTSIFFASEYLLRKIPGVQKHLLPKISFDKISVLQAKGEDVSFILQQAGQAIMHYNIWFGVGVMTILYLTAQVDTVLNQVLGAAPLSIPKLVFGLAITFSNMAAAKRLFGWAADGIQGGLEALSQDGKPEGETTQQAQP